MGRFTIYCLFLPSEGSVIVYYLSEFKMPAGQEAAVDNEMSSINNAEHASRIRVNTLVIDEVVSSGRVKAKPVIKFAKYCYGFF